MAVINTISNLFGINNNSINDMINVANNSIIPSRYTVDSFTFPPNITNDSKSVIARIKNVNVPNITLEMDSIVRKKKDIYIAKKRSIGQMTITFYESQNLFITTVFSNWINNVFDSVNDNYYRYENEYKGSVGLSPVVDFSKSNTSIINLSLSKKPKIDSNNTGKIFCKITPTNISELSFDNDNDESFLTVTVTFNVEFDDDKKKLIK